MTDLAAAERAVVEAAIAETKAEALARDAGRQAAQARNGSHRLGEHRTALRHLTDTQHLRRNAVQRLHELRREGG